MIIGLTVSQNLGHTQHVETKVKFSSTIEREEDGCKYICIATHFEKEQYSTFVERTLAANECLSDLSLE